jgi:2-polyprenyl-3-methyl-5-hydroxy-6-metoxy-1,4-benzoquinol methylase
LAESYQKTNFSNSALKYFISYTEFYYSSFTAHYFWWKKRFRVLKVFCKFLELKRKTGIRVLDIGFGHGNDLFLMAKEAKNQCVSFFGIDINPEHVEYVQGRIDYEGYSNIKVYQGEIQGLSSQFLPATFDFIVCSEVVEHLQKPDKAILDFSRLLVPGGWAVVTTPNLRNAISILANLFKIKKKKGNGAGSDTGEGRASYLGYGHISLKNYREWIRMFSHAGLRTLKIYRGPLIYSLAWVDREPILSGLLIALDGLLDRFFPLPQLAFSAVFLLEKLPEKT